MYSLWFLRDAPDVLLTVGSGRAVHQFAGHRTLLASHSGYLKAHLAADTHTQCVAVPNVSPEVFAPLLTFMYTGYLDLTPDNVYAVLLATHLLHMPRALDLCRAYLIQSQPQSHTLVKPVPSRKPIPSLVSGLGSVSAPTSSLYWTPPPLLSAPEAPFGLVFPPLADTTTADPTPTPAPTTTRESPPAIPSTSAERQPSPPPSCPSPCLSQTSDASDQVTVTVPGAKTGSKREGKVIVDVASCDGPVRFHRVLNQNYGKTKSSASSTNQGEKADVGKVYNCQFCEHTFKSEYCYQKHARRHLNTVAVKTPKPAKREVRLLDMNVQYYPCKTCGSKFPSYYFVHKHRKMCHPLEEAKAIASSSSGPPDSESSQLTV